MYAAISLLHIEEFLRDLRWWWSAFVRCALRDGLALFSSWSIVQLHASFFIYAGAVEAFVLGGLYILRSVFMSWSGAVAILVIFIDLAVHIEYSAQYRPTILIFCEFYLSQRQLLVNHWEVDCLSSAAVLHDVQFLRMFRVQTYSFDINRATSMVSNVMSLSVVLRRRTALF